MTQQRATPRTRSPRRPRPGDDAVWKALADPTRREILDRLGEKERTTGELCSSFPDLSRCAVMKHLGVLVEADLVLVRRVGRYRWNFLNRAPIRRIHDRWIQPTIAPVVAAAERFRAHVEREGVAPSPAAPRARAPSPPHEPPPMSGEDER